MDPSIPWAEQEPISHINIPEDIYDRYSSFFTSTYKGGKTRSRRLHSDFLQNQLDSRPSDASFNPDYVMMQSPMVRYSKMPFRMLCRRYGADLAFTPMMVAKDIHRGTFITDREEEYTCYDEWSHHSAFQTGQEGIEEVERPYKIWKLKSGDDSQHPLPEFTTCAADRPLIAQLAVNDDTVIPDATAVQDAYVDGFDINCGCPQEWVLKDGIGASQSRNPELVERLVKKMSLSTKKSKSIKIRIRENLQETVELVRRAVAMGVDWVTVHGRTREEFTKTPVRDDAIELQRAISGISVIVNGDISKPEHLTRVGACDGVLLARGALANPRLFMNHALSNAECLQDYLTLAVKYGGSFATHLHHISYMAHDGLNKGDRLYLARMSSSADIQDYLTNKQNIPYVEQPNQEYTYATEYSQQTRPQKYKTAAEDISPYSTLHFQPTKTVHRTYTNTNDITLE